jgi:hypothetical protein
MPKVSQLTADLATNFFTGYDGNRGLDFSLLRDGIETCTHPINREIHNVLAEGTIELGGSDYNREVEPREFSLRKYVSLNKMLTFDNEVTDTPYTRVFMVYWWDNALEAPSAASSPTNSNIRVRCIQHFSDAV